VQELTFVNQASDRKVDGSGAVQASASHDGEILLRRIRRENADTDTPATVLAASERTSSNGTKRLIREYELA
jgi:hypothetical protein